jgi:hypothetical protein
MGKPERKGPLRRPTRRWEDVIKMDVRWGGIDWVNLAQTRDQWRGFVNMVMDM